MITNLLEVDELRVQYPSRGFRSSVVYRGDNVGIGSAAQVTKDPEHPYAQQLLLAAPVADPVEQERRRALRARVLEDQRQQDEQVGAVA